jgi:hypothetical protein
MATMWIAVWPQNPLCEQFLVSGPAYTSRKLPTVPVQVIVPGSPLACSPIIRARGGRYMGHFAESEPMQDVIFKFDLYFYNDYNRMSFIIAAARDCWKAYSNGYRHPFQIHP